MLTKTTFGFKNAFANFEIINNYADLERKKVKHSKYKFSVIYYILLISLSLIKKVNIHDFSIIHIYVQYENENSSV